MKGEKRCKETKRGGKGRKEKVLKVRNRQIIRKEGRGEWNELRKERGMIDENTNGK